MEPGARAGQEDPRRHEQGELGPGARQKFDDELIGLDPADPEARAFAEHLDRMQHSRPGYTVEGYLEGVGEFARSANRANSHHRLLAILLVGLILLGVLVAVWDSLVTVISTFLG
ncbi:MAG: hypothetical protein ACRDQ5_04670 [Sciscionella sp.]